MNQVVDPGPAIVASTSTPDSVVPSVAFTVPLTDPVRLRPRFEREADNSLFDRFAWLYVFFRERIFRDDTARIIQALWPGGVPSPGERLIELGCGPGFYSCSLASRFPMLAVVGVDRAERQLRWAKKKARQQRLRNCRFAPDDVLELSHADESFDAIVAARLFTVLPNRERAVAEMFRVLRRGGKCVIAEPRFAVWASLPLLAMWFLAGVTRMNNGFCEPRKATVLSPTAFKALFLTQPWAKVSTWHEGRYQYALCEKG